MKHRAFGGALCLLILASCLAPALAASQDASEPVSVSSPSGEIRVELRLSDVASDTAAPVYRAWWKGRLVVNDSRLGLTLAGGPTLRSDFRIIAVERQSHDETYPIPVGKTSTARNHYHEAAVQLEQRSEPRRRLDLIWRAFDDGIAFRYRIPRQAPIDSFTIEEEWSQFALPDDCTARTLPLRSFTTPYEAYYRVQPLRDLKPGTLLGAPLLVEHPAGAWVAITEAALTDYAGMYLVRAEDSSATLETRLAPLPGDRHAKVKAAAPHDSPWRVVMIADDPGRLIESNLVFNLNEPCKITDTSWIKPGKTTFPWWNGYVLEGVGFTPGVNTATMKHYIDFCAERGIPYHSLDGLDIAWYGGPIRPQGPTDITRAAPSIDLPELRQYARQKGVRLRLWMHWKALQPQIDTAFPLYEKWGIEGVMVDFMDRDDQEMVNFYHEMAEKAARHHLTITFHGAYKPTGMERTWPNVLSYEAVLNQEYNKWQPPGVKGTPPEHNLDVAFVRMLAGPLDYHQGGMRNVLPEDYRFRDKTPPVQGTRGHQLAMYVVYQNHLPMMADYPAAYRRAAELPFLVQIPTTWDETRVLAAKVGESIVVARRKGENWYVGGMNGGEARTIAVPLKFLTAGTHAVEIYSDDPESGPTGLTHRTFEIDASGSLSAAMSGGGGFAAHIGPARK